MDSAAYSVEDFDDFASVDELLPDPPPPDSEPAVGGDAPATRDAGTDEDTAETDEDTEEFEPFQPGFAFAGENAADEESAESTAENDSSDTPSEQEPDPPVAATAAAAVAGVATAGTVPFDHEVAAQERLDEITAERLHSTSTQEYAGLAEHVARAADEDQELMAVAADMPGLERGIVGLDDVVEASGVEDTPAVTRRSSDLPLRVGTALLLLAVFIGSLYRPLLLGLLALVILGLAAGEFYTVLVRSGFNPLTVFGLAGVIGAMVGTWVFGPVAIPMSLAAALLLTLIFYTVVSGRSLPLFNAALTMMVAVWVGLGAFLFDMVQSPDFRWLIVAFIVTVAFMDICQYFVGRRLGRTPLAPRISPKKTVEGLVGGIFGALMVGVFFGLFGSGPFDLGSGLLLGLLVAVVAPFGDLAISVVKRALDVKDMGTILPGHGGVLDRIDAMLMVVPAAWVAYAWLGLLS
jgi:phosphatidate cytidylyltransferase